MADAAACARIVIAGVASGVGKTTLTAGLGRALRRRGLRVAMFKCGPDYLDPTYHARAAGSVSHNLDGWMMGKDAVLATFVRASAGADVALIEGVMGLFDGASPTGPEGSSAEIATWLGAPVLLVCDASGMARSVAALAQGFAAFDRDVHVAGIVCNRVGSRSHLELLQRALSSPPIVGGLPKQPQLAFAERHLGLHHAAEALGDEIFDAWAEQVEAWVDVDAILTLARTAISVSASESVSESVSVSVSVSVSESVSASSPPTCRIGIAFDQAFNFYYEDNLRRLQELGAELVRFSPVHDAHLPNVDGLYFGGGYPELHAQALAQNSALRAEVAAFAAAGAPVYAECGGLMYLSRAICTLDGAQHPMVGIVPGRTEMRDRLQALGYVEVETQTETLLGPAGLRLRGHQFRYSELQLDDDVTHAYGAHSRRTGKTQPEGYATHNVLASYVHAHWASNPLAAAGFVRACSDHARGRR